MKNEEKERLKAKKVERERGGVSVCVTLTKLRTNVKNGSNERRKRWFNK